MASNNKDYDEYIKQTQAEIKSQAQEHNKYGDYLLDEYNKSQPKENRIYDTAKNHLVKTGSKGGFGTNYIAQSGVANGASNPQKNEPVNEEKTMPPMQSTGTGADVAPVTGSSKADANYARISDAYEKYKAGDIDETTFRVMTGTTPDIWEKTSGRLKQDANDYRTQQIVDNRTRQTMNTLPDEERHMFQAQLEDNWVNPTREDFDMDAARAAIQAQQKGMAQQKRYEDLMARYNSSKLIGEPYDEPLGPPAPTATQNYGNYYDGRSGNQYPETEKVVNPENIVAPNQYRDQTAYGHVYSPYSPYESGQPRTPAKDSTLRYYPTPSEEASQTGTPAVDLYSPMGVYQQNQNAGVSGFGGNPQNEPEAQALLTEYNNRMAAHGDWMPPDQRTIYQDAAHGDMTPDQRNAAIYDQFLKNGMSKAEILEWAQTEAENYMSPEEAMRFYFYVDNH